MSATTATATATTTPTTLATRAAGLMTKASALGVVEKSMAQAIDAKRVFPPMAQDFSAQLGYDLPLKTRDFVRVVGHLLQATEKPLKGVISKRKGEIIGVLAELVGALTDTAPVSLPEWAMPKERAKKPEAAEAGAESAGALAKANTLANAEANATKAEASAKELNAAFGADILARAVNVILAHASELSESQREMLLATLASTSEALI